MQNNISREDANEVIKFLQQDPLPQLTNGPKIKEFEQAWSDWVGVKYSVFVNSGSSANQLTMLGLKHMFGTGEIIVPPLTWISDISSVIQNGFTPVFCDINLKNLSFDLEHLKKKITPLTRAIFTTHVLGLNAISYELLKLCEDNNILLIEDACEAHGATYLSRKVGAFGFASNFSFYFAHHMSTIEGGMICTQNERFYQWMRSFRSHGMLREITDETYKQDFIEKYPELNKDFIFISPAYNMRSTEINAVLGLSQLKNLDNNNTKRKANFEYFIKELDSNKYITNLDTIGQCNYAFIVILKDASFNKRNLIEKTLQDHKIEFRRGLSGGGSQLKQPYIDFRVDQSEFPNMEHIHHFSWYIGNYPELKKEKIDYLLNVLNNI